MMGIFAPYFNSCYDLHEEDHIYFCITCSYRNQKLNSSQTSLELRKFAQTFKPFFIPV